MNKKEKIRFIIINAIIMFLVCSGSVYAASNYFYTGSDIGYDNSESGLDADNVQGAIDDLREKATNYNEIRKMIYPVGSIYISVTDDTVAKVQERFGGTWENFGSGQTLVGVNPSDSDFNTVNKTGGSKSQSYTPAGTNKGTSITVAQLPAHSHTFTGTAVNTSTAGGHTHTISFNASGSEAKGYGASGSLGFRDRLGVTGSSSTSNTGAHAHSVTAKGSISNTGSGQAHTHTFTGTQATISHLQPYVTVYMYKRTA